MSLMTSLFFLVGCCTIQQQVTTTPEKTSIHNLSPQQDQLSSPPNGENDQVSRVKKIQNLTVAITKLSSKLTTLCSAVWIKKGFLLTANHCVDDNGLLGYMTFDDDKNNGRLKLAIVHVVDKNNDIAVLSVDPSTEPFHENVSFDTKELNAGEDVDIMGHTVGYKWTYSKGLISSIRKNIEGPTSSTVEKVIQISAPVWMGNSGGGAFDHKGKFVGLCSWVSTSGPFLSFYIHRDIVVKFLSDEGIIY